jgi:hypothetical protein
MNNIEIFKDVLGYEGLYQVSNLGNVKSLNYNHTGKYKNLKPVKKVNGYYQVSICKNGNKKAILIHVLVAQAFLGHIPDGTMKIVPDHKDGDKSNNRADNLELITNRENISRHYLTQKKSSKYTGVSWDKNKKKWQAYITIEGKRKHLGLFENEYDAHLVYKKALNELVNK